MDESTLDAAKNVNPSRFFPFNPKPRIGRKKAQKAQNKRPAFVL